MHPSTSCNIASSLTYSKLDYCNSLLLNFHASSLSRFLNSAACAAINTSKFSHNIAPLLKSLHCFKVEQRIHYKILLLINNALDTNHPIYLCSLLTVQDI
jgi:hypothetical protein